MSVQVGKAGFITKEQEIYQGDNKVNEIYAGDQMVYPATYVKKRVIGYEYDIWQLPKKRIYNHGEILRLYPPRGIEHGIRINKYFENGKVVRDTDEVKAVFLAPAYYPYRDFNHHVGILASTVYYYAYWLELYKRGERDVFIEPIPLHCYGASKKSSTTNPPTMLYSDTSDRAFFLANYSTFNPITEEPQGGQEPNKDIVSPFIVTTYNLDISYIPKVLEEPKVKRKDFLTEEEYVYTLQEKYRFSIDKYTVRVIPNEGMYLWEGRKIPNLINIIRSSAKQKLYHNEKTDRSQSLSNNQWEETYIRGFYECGIMEHWDGDKPVMLVNPSILSREISYFVFDTVPFFYQLIGNFKEPFNATLTNQTLKPSSIAFLDKQLQYYPARGKIYTYKYNEKVDDWRCTSNGVKFDGIQIYGEDNHDFDSEFSYMESHVRQFVPQYHHTPLMQAFFQNTYLERQVAYGPIFMGYKTYTSEEYIKNNRTYKRAAWQSVWNIDPGDAESFSSEDESIRWQVINDGL